MQSDGFIREVDEELQRERVARLWQRYGTIIIGVAVIVIAATAGKVGWDAWQDRQLAQQATAFAAAENAFRTDLPEAADKFAVLADGLDGNAAAIARLREAQVRLADGQDDAAVATLEAVAATAGIDAILRDIAAVAAAEQRLDADSLAELRASLEQQGADGAAFRYSARELLALAALEAGERDESLEQLRSLANDGTAPEPIRQRAGELLAALGAPLEEPTPSTSDEAS